MQQQLLQQPCSPGTRCPSPSVGSPAGRCCSSCIGQSHGGPPHLSPARHFCTQEVECVVWLRPAVCRYAAITFVVNSHVRVRACCCAGPRPSGGGGWQYAHIHCLVSCVFRQLLCSAAQQHLGEDLTCGRSAGAVGACSGCVCLHAQPCRLPWVSGMTVQTPPGVNGIQRGRQVLALMPGTVDCMRQCCSAAMCCVVLCAFEPSSAAAAVLQPTNSGWCVWCGVRQETCALQVARMWAHMPACCGTGCPHLPVDLAAASGQPAGRWCCSVARPCGAAHGSQGHG
jgi:hypothetical protein